MTNKTERNVLLIDEAKFLLSGRSRLPGQSPTPNEAAASVVDLLCTYAEVEATVEQRAEAARVVRSLPDDDSSIERFVTNCEGQPSLKALAEALRERLDGPWRLL